MLDAKVSRVGDRTLVPVAPEDRVATLDILRGFAMFGVLWSNLHFWYGGPWSVTALDSAIGWVVDWMVESRFYSLLGFLFGIGFAIQLQRAEARDSDGGKVFLRRMLALLGFGLVHGLFIWSGDILAEYALLGFLLVLYRGLPGKRLAVAAALTYLLLPYVIPIIFRTLNVPVGSRGFFQGGKVATSIYGHGTFAQIAIYRSQDFLYRLRGLATSGGYAGFLTLFLLGMMAARAGLVSKLCGNTRQNTKWLLGALTGSLVIMAGALYWFSSFQTWWPARLLAGRSTWHDLAFWSPRGRVLTLSYDLMVWGNSAAYASALALLALRPRWSARLAPLAAVGRMPLTTYLTQSILCTTLFYNYGFGWFGQVKNTGILAITVTIFALQLAASSIWLRLFRFGPAEWLWRSCAYLRAQPMKVLLPPTGSGR